MEGLSDEVAAISTGQRYRSQEKVVCSDYRRKEGPKRSLFGQSQDPRERIFPSLGTKLLFGDHEGMGQLQIPG